MSDSFILYTSYYALIEGLTDEQLGQLTRAIFLYARDGEAISLEPVVRMAFGFIVDDMKRNKAKYEEKVERWRANGKKGGRPRKNPKRCSIYQSNLLRVNGEPVKNHGYGE